MDYNIIPEMIGLATALPATSLGMHLPALLAIGSTLLLLSLIAKDELSPPAPAYLEKS